MCVEFSLFSCSKFPNCCKFDTIKLHTSAPTLCCLALCPNPLLLKANCLWRIASRFVFHFDQKWKKTQNVSFSSMFPYLVGNMKVNMTFAVLLCLCGDGRRGGEHLLNVFLQRNCFFKINNSNPCVDAFMWSLVSAVLNINKYKIQWSLP